MDFEKLVISGIIKSEKFRDIALPYIKAVYFEDTSTREIYKKLYDFITQYNTPPDETTLTHHCTDLIKEKKINVDNIIQIYNYDFKPELERYLKDETELWCRQRAVYIELSNVIELYDNEKTSSGDLNNGIEKLRTATNISFETTIGHDWVEDALNRYEFYTDKVDTIPFNLDIMNKVTGGGVPRKTMNIVMAGVNSGKTGFLCYLAGSYCSLGYNVLYITLEMREELISKRIDANLLDIDLERLHTTTKDEFMRGVNFIKQKGFGKLIVKEYPTGVAHAGHFNSLLKELKQKKNLTFDIIIIDYIGICASSRSNGNINSYSYLKNVSEELRGLAVENNAVLWTAVQLNRGGFGSTDVEMTDVADSWGIPASADFMIALIRTEELDKMSQILVKQVKSRYGNKSDNLTFRLGVIQNKQRYYDTDTTFEKKVEAKEEHSQNTLRNTNVKNKMRFNGFA